RRSPRADRPRGPGRFPYRRPGQRARVRRLLGQGDDVLARNGGEAEEGGLDVRRPSSARSQLAPVFASRLAGTTGFAALLIQVRGYLREGGRTLPSRRRVPGHQALPTRLGPITNPGEGRE